MQGPSGDSESARNLAFMEAYKKFAVTILRYFLRRTGNKQDAEDLSQTLWDFVYRKFSPGQFGQIGLLLAKSRQIYLADLRHRGVRNFVALVRQVPDMADPLTAHEPTTESDEQTFKTDFWNQFSGIDLTQIQKEVFWMKEREGYTYEQIAARTHMPLSTLQECVKKVCSMCAAYLKDES